jgi:1-acyl-sn-glycerol-3-phosphate acyltransferase
MKFVGKIFSLVWKIYFLLNFFISLALIYPLLWYFLQDEKRFSKAFLLTRWWGKYLIYSNGMRYKVHFKGQVPEPPYIICANHTSYLDIILTYCVFPHYFVFAGKQELSKVPLFKIYFKKMNVLVDRKSRVGSHKAFVDLGVHLDQGHSVAIFPEGTISKAAPELAGFKNGPFKLALDKRSTIVPVTFLNNWNVLGSGSFFNSSGRPGKCTVVVDEHIVVEGMQEEDLKNRVRGIIENNIEHFLAKKKF